MSYYKEPRIYREFIVILFMLSASVAQNQFFSTRALDRKFQLTTVKHCPEYEFFLFYQNSWSWLVLNTLNWRKDRSTPGRLLYGDRCPDHLSVRLLQKEMSTLTLSAPGLQSYEICHTHVRQKFHFYKNAFPTMTDYCFA